MEAGRIGGGRKSGKTRNISKRKESEGVSRLPLVGDRPNRYPGKKQYLTRAGFLMEAFTGGSNWFKRQLATNSKELKPPQVRGLSEPGFRRHWSVSVTHRFLRRGKILGGMVGVLPARSWW